MRSFRLFFIPLFFLLLFINGSPQDFIPTVSVPQNNNNWSPSMEGMIREKLMPYSIKAIKEKGISQEFHITGMDTVRIFFYSTEGLLTRYEHNSFDYYHEKSTEVLELRYDKKNNLIEIIGDEYLQMYLERNSNGQIMRISHSESDRKSGVKYKYRNGQLIQAGELKRRGNFFLIKKKIQNFYLCEVKTDIYGRVVESYIYEGGGKLFYDKYGRWTGYSGGGLGLRDEYEITYEENLMIQAIRRRWSEVDEYPNLEIETVKIIYEYAHKRDKLK